MSVYANMTIYARTVNGQRQYFDLAQLWTGESTIYGIFNQSAGAGLWRETFDESEFMARLQAWTDEPWSVGKPPVPMSQLTPAGRAVIDQFS